MLLFCKIQIHYRRHKNSENRDLKKGKALQTSSHSIKILEKICRNLGREANKIEFVQTQTNSHAGRTDMRRVECLRTTQLKCIQD